MSALPALDTARLDQAVSDLRGGAGTWAATGITERIALLERMMPRIADGARAMVDDAARAKGNTPGSPWSAEEWTLAPWALAQTAGAYLRVLRRIAAGKDPIAAGAVQERGGRVIVDVFPASGWDHLLFSGLSAQVWTRPGTTAAQVRERAAGEYRGRAGEPGVALVLGAGNVAAITALDILHKLYVDGQVVIAKMNPVNDYLRPHFEKIFADFTARGWVRFVDGGAAEGAHLATHDDVDSIHVTGSDRTHDAIVWGTGEDAGQRRAEDRPLNTKPFCSELGGVSPCIVVPGDWSDADLRYQAEHIVTSKMNNSGHNCVASQILIVPRDWSGTPRLLDHIREILRELPARGDYYPGAGHRIGAVLEAHPDAEVLGGDEGDACRVLVPDLAQDGDDILLTTEVFGSAIGVVRLPASDPASFLADAVDFANDRLPGTLGAMLLVHPRTEKAHQRAVDSAVENLRYGTLGINVWSAVGFLLGYTPWGAHPGHTRQNIGSGIGFVHNAFMIDEEHVEKTVLRAPFAPAPRGLFTGSPSLSPRPPYFVTNRTALTTLERVTRFTTAPGAAKLPAIFASALRG